MGDCCNPRTLSLVSASFQIVGILIAFICIFALGAFVSAQDFNGHEDELAPYFAIGLVVGIILLIWGIIELILLIILIVGVQKNHLTMVSIYVYPTIVFMAINAIGMVFRFIMGFVAHMEASQVFLAFFVQLIQFGFAILMFSPIYIFHKRLRKSYYHGEHHNMHTTVTMNKPQYAV